MRSGVPPEVVGCLRALGLAEDIPAYRIPGGTGTQLWRLSTSPEPLILRLYPPGDAPLAAQRREAAFLRHLNSQDLPIPRVHATGVHDRTSYLLLSACPGRPVGRELRTQPWRAYGLGFAAGGFHAALHQVPVPERLRSLRAAPAEGLEQEAELSARLQRVPPLRDSILHLDFHPMNMLTDGRRITGVVDWTSAAVGDPRCDLARTAVLLRCPRTDRAATAPATIGICRLFERGWAAGYAEGCGRDPALADALQDRGSQVPFLAAAAAQLAWEMRRVRRAADLQRMQRLVRAWKRSADIAAS